jgi:hypothetical protein
MASTAYVTGGETMSVSRVFSRTFAVIRDNPVTVFGISFLFGALPSLAVSWLQQSVRAGVTDRYASLGVGVIYVVSALVSLVLLGLVQGALVEATLAFTERRRASFGECAAIGLRFALPVVGLMLLLALAVFAGLALFVVPGIILFVMWSVASPALVAERTGVIGAFGRSRQLTKGARWKVFGVEIVIIILWWMLSGVLGVIAFTSIEHGGAQAIAEHGLPFGWLVVNALLGTLLNAFWSTAQTALYVELRNWKDGHSDSTLQDIFA